MQQYPILTLDTTEGSSGLKIEYITEDTIHLEINGEAASHTCNVRLITEYLLRDLAARRNTLGFALSEEDISDIALASTLHDVGKLKVPKSILDSHEVLSPVEYDIVKKHSAFGEKMIREAGLNDVRPKVAEYAAQIARSHHERIDGSGYPDGLCGDEIPLCAQVVALADVYDALTSTRSYKKAFTQDVALQMIANGNCGAFDERLVASLNRAIKHHDLIAFSESLKNKLRIVSSYEELQLKRVLLVGNTEYVDRSFIDQTFPRSKVTVVGNSGVSHADRVKLFSSRKASIETVLEAYEFDLIVFFSRGLSFHSNEESDAKELRKVLKCASETQKNTKILYLSPLDAAFEGKTDRSIVATSNEKICDFYASQHAMNVKTIQIPYLYSGTYKKDFLYDLFEQMYAGKTVTISESSLAKMHFLAMSDLSALILRITDNWKSGSGILTVGDEFRLSFADLAKRLTEIDEDTKVDFTDSDCSGILRSNYANLRSEYGWYARISLIDDLEEQYERFLATKQKKSPLAKMRSWLATHALFTKTVELFLLFAASEILTRLTDSTVVFSVVDFRTIFVVIIATMYGTTFGIASAFLASASYFISRVEAGTNALTIFYEPTNWIAFILFFFVGGLCGYVHLKNEDTRKTVEEQSELLQEKLSFTSELYEETLEDKKELKQQIVRSKDSFGKMLNIAKTLNSVVPHHLYLKIIETFEDALENKSIAIYLIKPNSPFGRLQVASRDTLDTVSRSIDLDNYAPVIEKIKDGGIWKNTELNLDFPAYAAGVHRDGELILMIFLWHADMDQRSLYYANLFKILCDLAQISLIRAYDYSLALYEKQHIPGTRIMTADYFKECVENHMALSAKKVMSFIMLEIDDNGHTPDEVDKMIGSKIRTTDILGITHEGKMQIILPYATEEDLVHILPRFEGMDLQVSILK